MWIVTQSLGALLSTVTAFFSLPLVNPPIESSRALLLLSDLGSEGAAGGLPAAGGGGGPGGGGGGGAGAAGVLGVEVGLEAGRDAGLEFLSFTVEFLAVGNEKRTFVKK